MLSREVISGGFRMLDTAASSGRHCLGTVSISETQLTSSGGISPERPTSGPATVNRMSLHDHLLKHVRHLDRHLPAKITV